MLVLSRAEVHDLLDREWLLDVLADAFVALSAGEASAPPRTAVWTPERNLMGLMGAHLPGAFAAKLVTVFHDNPKRGLPGHQALIAVFDEHTGAPLAVMDGTEITAARTGAASAVAVRALAREDARVLAIVGGGVQGYAHAWAVPAVRDFDRILIASRTPQSAHALAQRYDGEVASIEDAVRAADVVCLCTQSDAPVLDADWVTPGTHVGSVGFSPTGGELPPALARRARLVVESRVAFEPPPAGAAELQGLDPDAAAELGEVLAGTRPGRTSGDEITVYKSMGHAVEDAAAARLVYERARAAGIGAEINVG